MNAAIMHLASISVKTALLGGLAWIQLLLLRRARAAPRQRLCSVALIGIVLVTAAEFVTPTWIAKGPVVTFTAASAEGVPSSAARLQIETLVVLAWLGGAALMLVRAMAGRTLLSRVRRHSTSAGAVGRVEIRIAETQTPVLAGLLRPAILVPPAWRNWTDEQRRMVLAHELNHFRQGDCWSNLLAQAVRCLLWFHPVVWLLAERASREQELACDEAVIASGHRPQDYAAFLLDAARNLRSGEIFACAMAGSGARSLKLRFTNLLDLTPRPVVSRRFALLLASLAAIALTLTVVRPVWAQKDEKVYKIDDGVLPPKVLLKVEPKYTEEARDAKIQGTVILSAVITPEGKVDNIEVVQSLDPGLDDNAITAVKGWTFQPGTKDGQPVAVRATIEINFRLE